MMTKKKELKIQLWAIIISLVLVFIMAFILHNERDKLLETGTETVGIVTHTRTSKTNDPYIINFSFIKDDTLLDGQISLTLGEKEQFYNAFVGYTYKVRFFSDDPPKKARIYIDEPVDVSEEEYLRLLERVDAERQNVEKAKTWWKNF